MSKTNRYKPTMAKIEEARSEGQYVRAKSWGGRKDPKIDRKDAKREMRRYR